MAKIDNTPCPWCGNRTLHIGEELRAKPIGSYSLSGTQMKVSAYTFPILVCHACGLEVEGRYEDGQAFFDIPDKEVNR
jgi:hypothetical protein